MSNRGKQAGPRAAVRVRTIAAEKKPPAPAKLRVVAVPPEPRLQPRVWAAAGLLAIATLAVYLPAVRHPFLNYDDPDYVTSNVHVQQGLSVATLRWAMTAMQSSNWHPVTWMSHALDWQIFGADAAGHHFTSVFLHGLNAALLFLLLAFATRKLGRSLLVAALFALHPINVESVAWIAERKTLLSMFFLLLTVAAYGWYARRPGIGRYAAVFGLFALGLMAKPMIVTLPFALLLLDYWPLRRVEGSDSGMVASDYPQKSWQGLALEKIPLLLLSAGSCVLTVLAQRGSIPSSDAMPFGVRLANACVAYVGYLGKAIWPTPLAVYYPHEGAQLPAWMVVVSALFLIAITAAVWKLRSRRYLLVGWLWFVGTMVPMIGLVQVGNQAMADRYAYLPLIGIFVVIAWGAADILGSRLSLNQQAIIASIVLAGLSAVTLRQITFWRDNVTLWSHAIEATQGNEIARHNLYVAEDNLAYELLSQGRFEEALQHFQRAAQYSPGDALSHWALAADAEDRGNLEQAFSDYYVVTQNPQNARQLASAYLSMAVITTEAGQYGRAAELSQKAMQADAPTVHAVVAQAERNAELHPSPRTLLRSGLLLEQVGQAAKALAAYEQVERAAPSPRAQQLVEHLKKSSGE